MRKETRPHAATIEQKSSHMQSRRRMQTPHGASTGVYEQSHRNNRRQNPTPANVRAIKSQTVHVKHSYTYTTHAQQTLDMSM